MVECGPFFWAFLSLLIFRPRLLHLPQSQWSGCFLRLVQSFMVLIVHNFIASFRVDRHLLSLQIFNYEVSRLNTWLWGIYLGFELVLMSDLIAWACWRSFWWADIVPLQWWRSKWARWTSSTSGCSRSWSLPRVRYLAYLESFLLFLLEFSVLVGELHELGVGYEEQSLKIVGIIWGWEGLLVGEHQIWNELNWNSFGGVGENAHVYWTVF